jgi:DNA-binding SARP family transcriptional activator/WD40 repeat protein/energy-coupling factor transporter ATP-binding protein EcfA2
MLPGMSIAVLGPVTVDGDDAGLAPRERVVLGVLTVRRGEVVSADVLADALWGEKLPPASWAKVVQGCVVRLRKVLGADAIETNGQGYRLAVPAEELDAHRFERLVRRAQELLTLGESDRALYVVDEALALWRGKALTELEGWEHGRTEAARLEEQRLHAEELRIDAALQAGRFRQVLAEAQARVAQAPLREQRWTLLALAQYQAGRQSDALRTLHQARQMLVRELGLDPGPDIVTLEAAILRQDPSLIAARLPAPSPACPYLGLVPYDVEDAEVFFGRDQEVADCLSRLSATGVLVVVGPSGSGKSSLIRAGVAAALQRDGLRVLVITPGARPLDALTVLARSGDAPVLFVDQCEEAFTLCQGADDRTRFFTALTEHSERSQLIVALRADRLGDLSKHPEFAGLVERGLYLLKGMDEEHLRATVEAPARQAGLLLEPGLVDLLVRDVEGEPGSLPMLSHALRQTWERREGSTLTVAGYQSTGGIRGAVAQSAEKVYEQVGPEQRPMMRDLMLRLVAPNPDGDPVRARVPRRVVATDDDRERIIETLVEARLVTTDDETVELAHEALARAWPRLKEWLDDDVEGQRIWRHVASAADTWDAMGRPDSELYRGVRLARAVEWRDRSVPDLSRVEREFLEASSGLAAAEQRSTEEQARRQVRVNRRLRTLMAGVAALALVAAAGGIVATRQAQRADSEADAARAQELTASALGVMDEDPSLAKLLAVAASDTAEPTVATNAALHQAWSSDLSVARYGPTFDVGVVTADIAPEGDRIVVAGILQPDGSGSTLEVVDPNTDEPVWSVGVNDGGHESAFVAEPRFTADGEQVVAGVYWDPLSWRRVVPFEGEIDEPVGDRLGVHVWDAESGELLDRIDLGRCGGVVVAVSPTHAVAKTLHGPADVIDGCRWRDGSIGVELIDRRNGERTVLTETTDTVWLWGAALSDDGRYVAFDDGRAGEVVVVDVNTGAERLREEGRGVRDLNGDGSLLLFDDQPMRVLDVATGSVTATFDEHNGQSLFALFAPSGETVYSDGDDGALREWDATDGRERFVYPDIGNGPISVTRDGLIAVSNGELQMVTLLDTRLRGEVDAIETCEGSPVADTLSVVGSIATLRTLCDDATAPTTFAVDLGGGSMLHTRAGGQFGSLAVAPDGSRYVDQQTVGDGEDRETGPPVVHDRRTGQQIVELDALPDHDEWSSIWRVRWSPDGALIAATFQGRLAVWEAATGALLHMATTDEDAEVVDVLFTPDSGRLITTTSRRRIVAREVGSWEVVEEREVFMEGSYSLGLVGFSADRSSMVAVGGFQVNATSALVWLDPTTFETQRLRSNLHEGSITAAALNPSASSVATASSDGRVRVWDVATGNLVHEVPFGGDAIQGVAFVDDEHLAIARDGGALLVITIDPDELLAIVEGSLTRGFTLQECSRFNFGDDCPTVAELDQQAPSGDDADALAGTFRVEWTHDDLVATIVDYIRSITDEALSPGVTGFAGDLATELAGTYTVTFADGRFDIINDRMEDPFCIGSYFVRDGRAWLRPERGWSYPVKIFDAAFEVDDEELRFDPYTFRGEGPYLLLFAARPLERIS